MKLGDTNVGDLVYFKVSGSRTAFRVMHHGKPDSTYDDSFTGGTILMLDYSESPFSTSMVAEVDEIKGDYGSSYMHTALNSTWFSRLDSAIASAVVQVKVPYRQGTSTDPYVVASGSNGLSAKIWLPSIAEVARKSMGMGTLNSFYVTEGAKFDYFKDAASSFYSNWKISDSNGIDAGWGTRTPGTYTSGDYADFFCKISSAGESYPASRNDVSVRPCMVLPDTLLIDVSDQVLTGDAVPVKIDGAWKDSVAWGKQGGVWHEMSSIHKKVAGSWKH